MFVERLNRLYEQGVNSVRIGQYVRRWVSWVTATGITLRDGLSESFRRLCRASPKGSLTPAMQRMDALACGDQSGPLYRRLKSTHTSQTW